MDLSLLLGSAFAEMNRSLECCHEDMLDFDRDSLIQMLTGCTFGHENYAK
jgi:hypothetical protein